MKKKYAWGKILIAIAVLNLFRQAQGFHGYGGYVNNTWEILLTSLTLFIVGLILYFKNNDTKNS